MSDAPTNAIESAPVQRMLAFAEAHERGEIMPGVHMSIDRGRALIAERYAAISAGLRDGSVINLASYRRAK